MVTLPAVVDDRTADALRRALVLVACVIAVTLPFGRPPGGSLAALVAAEVLALGVAVALWLRLTSPLLVLRIALAGSLVLMTLGISSAIDLVAAGTPVPIAMRFVTYGTIVTALAMLVLGSTLGGVLSAAVQGTWLWLAVGEPQVAMVLADGGGLLVVARYQFVVLLLLWAVLQAHTAIKHERDHAREEARTYVLRDKHRQALEEQRSRRLAEAAHELRSPVATLAAGAESLAAWSDDGLSDDFRDRILEAVQHAALRLDQRTKDLLDAARDRVLAAPVRRIAVDPASVVAVTLADLSMLTSDHDVVVDAPEGTVARLDPDGLDHILTNLVHNATKYTPPGTRIDVRLRREDDTTVLVVQDHGPGVPVDVRDELFTPYTRDESHAELDGAGVGLSVAQTWARRHGGDIQLLDTDEGAAFHVLLPDDDGRGEAAVRAD